nr:MAG TPA: hypothetical protein [Bacteriophage sp.]DAL84143.1 MAG TPA: hypothetical protein [Caudoviricetes sp.]DAR34591.1 MAG TPA: hypothetical protein [Caudoviricetes sp.]
MQIEGKTSLVTHLRNGLTFLLLLMKSLDEIE